MASLLGSGSSLRIISAAAAAFLFCSSLRAQPESPRVLGYYPDWNRGAYTHALIPYQYLTHIAHAFLIPNADGSLGGTSGFAYPNLLQAAHQAGVKVVVALGGWGQSTGFSPMAADTAARRRFVQNVLSFLVTNGYDGVDLDWEYPGSAADSANLTALVRDLRTAFSRVNTPLSISLALPATGWSGKWFNVSAMKDMVDWFGIMTYDFYGSWTAKAGPNSPLYGNFSTNSEGWVDYSCSYYTATRDLPAGKLLIGLPFYGWVFNAPSMYGPSTSAVQRTYSAIAAYLTQGWTRYWDSEGMVPYLINPSGTQTVSYDDTASIRLKCEYARAKLTGGVMIWAIGQDHASGEQPLLRTVGTWMGLAASVAPPAHEAPPSGFMLHQNHPNPFNPSTVIRYQLPVSSDVRVTVRDLLGREVSVLLDERQEPGVYEVTFAAAGLSSGVYFYTLHAGRFVQTHKMVAVK